ncbi:MAG: adenylyl cyclase, partial [Chthoniobacterales bacterium]
MSDRNFFAELKRRNVYKVAVAYAVVGWLAVQISSTVLPTFHAPEWVLQTLVVLVVLGFLIALVIAWAFEMTPQGIKRTEDVSPDEKLPQWSRDKFLAMTSIVALLAAGLLAFQLMRGKHAVPSEISDKSIAVLPFASLSEDKANAYFADGIQDEILTRLSKIAQLKVISRTSTQQYQSKPGNLSEIARQLGVAHILEGSVQKSNDSVRVNVQLIKADGDSHLWAETYDRKLTDIFAVESEVAQRIAGSLEARLTGREQQQLADVPTKDPHAYEAYLRG